LDNVAWIVGCYLSGGRKRRRQRGAPAQRLWLIAIFVACFLVMAAVALRI